MRIAALLLRGTLIVCLTALGGALAAAAYGLAGQPGPYELGPWIPFFAGATLANFLARWWSHNHPPRFSAAWQEDQISANSL